MARYLCDLSPQINNPDLIVKKKYENSSIGTFYKTPVLFNTVKVINHKGCLRNSHSQEEPKAIDEEV